MNQVILDPAQSAAVPADASGGADKSSAPSLGADLFRTALATTLAGQPRSVAPPAASAAPAPAADVQPALTAAITKMLNAGASQADVITSLAKQLAISVARTLQTPSPDARGKLQTLFATALAPPGSAAADSGSVADRAAKLAQQYLELTAQADAIANQQAGQQKRIAGSISDAPVAKDLPARTTTATNAKLSRAGAAGSANALAAAGGDSSAANALLIPSLVTAALPGSSNARLPAANADAAYAMNADVTVATSNHAIAASTDAILPHAAPDAALTAPVARRLATDDAAAGSQGTAAATLGGDDAQAQLKPIEKSKRSLGATAASSESLEASAVNSQVAAALAVLATSRDGVKAVGSETPGKVLTKVAATQLTNNARPFVLAAKADASASLAAASNPAPAGAAGSVQSQPASSTSDGAAPLPPGSVSLTDAAVAGDGRSVALSSSAATQSGGDTGLGRILTRASLAADARQAGTGDAAAAPAATATATAADVAPETTLAVFVKAFEVALKAAAPADVTQHAQHEPQALTALALPAHEAGNSTPAFALSVAPFTIEQAGHAAATAPALPAAPVDHSAIADQVLRGAFMRNVGQSSEIRLTLVPNSLGDVNVKLIVDAGNVSAHVLAQTADARDAIVAAQPQLVKSLTDSGLKLTSFTVDLQGGGFAGFSQQNDGSRNGNRSQRAADSSDTDGGSDELLEAIPSFAPSSVTGAGAGYYNYLA